MKKILLSCFVAVLLTGCGALSHMLAQPVVSGGEGIWKYKNTTIYGSHSSFRIQNVKNGKFSVSNFLKGG